MKTNKGFTLIELLVVIAIIGILSSVVLASLNTARNKGSDAAVKANLANARAQAELYYDDKSNKYWTSTSDNVCDSTTGISAAVEAAGDASSGDAACISGGGVAEENGFTVTAELSETTQGYFCVDSTGAAATTSAGVTDSNADAWTESTDACAAL